MNKQTTTNSNPSMSAVTPDAESETPSAAEEKASKEAAVPAVSKRMSEEIREPTRHRLPWGVAGVFVWLLMFSTGVLVPAEPSRINLGWKPLSNVETKAINLEERITKMESKVNNTNIDKLDTPETQDPGKLDKANTAETTPIPTTSGAQVLPGTSVQGEPALGTETKKSQSNLDNSIKGEKQELAPAGPTDGSKTSKFSSFIVAMLTFTPLNVGFLCVLAAFIGGCSINKNEIHRIHQEILDLEANPPVRPNPELARLRQRLDYLTEHPGYSTIRGLVVYLIIISGLFIIGAPLIGENGSQSITLAQYMKLAGLFSFFGYLAGYDPTVFSSVIGLGTRQLNSGNPPK